MAQEKKGFIARMIEGKEKDEAYARSTLPTNRWQLFWDIFKGNFGKIVKVNLLMIIFFLPTIAILFINGVVGDSQGIFYPFSANLTIGYPAVPGQTGLAEMLTFQSNQILYIALIVSMAIASVGLSGGMYVMRNMIWTEGIFVTNDFWRGVKLNYKNALQTTLFFTIVLTICGLLISGVELITAIQGGNVWLDISAGISYGMIGFALLISFWMIALGVNYKYTFWTMFRNAIIITIGALPQSLFFGAIALIPYALLYIPVELFILISLGIIFVFGFSYTLLVWLDFAQWLFDKFINPRVKGAKVGRGIYNKDGSSTISEDASAAELEYRRILLSQGRSQLVSKPIKPIDDDLQVYELPKAFTREDLQRLRQSKEQIKEDSEAYVEEHKNDLRYVEYNRQFDELQKALQDSDVDKKSKKKRASKNSEDK